MDHIWISSACDSFIQRTRIKTLNETERPKCGNGSTSTSIGHHLIGCYCLSALLGTYQYSTWDQIRNYRRQCCNSIVGFWIGACIPSRTETKKWLNQLAWRRKSHDLWLLLSVISNRWVVYRWTGNKHTPFGSIEFHSFHFSLIFP